MLKEQTIESGFNFGMFYIKLPSVIDPTTASLITPRAEDVMTFTAEVLRTDLENQRRKLVALPEVRTCTSVDFETYFSDTDETDADKLMTAMTDG